MKKLRITVRGISYEVLVEVLEDNERNDAGTLPQTGRIGTRRIADAAAGSTPAIAPVPSQAPGSAPPTHFGGDPDTLAAPIAGTVQKVFVEAGKDVEAKTPVILLDAMKMDTYIYAPRHGRVAEVCVKPGDSVQIGTPLIRYQPEE
jgi:biotin carboxyl carrier protein